MMAKRIITLIICVLLVFGMLGCAGDGPEETAGAAEPIEDIYPEMKYGVWETDVLKSEPGNYDRAARVSKGGWAETATGYYNFSGVMLYYADKTNPGNWVPLCSKPNCYHSDSPGSTCLAYVHGVCFADGRIYFLVDAKDRPGLYTGKKSGYILCSMAMDGSDQKAEYVWEDAMLSGAGSYSAALCQTGLTIGTQQLQEDGSRLNQLFLADANGARCIYSWSEVDSNLTRIAMFPQYFAHLSGEELPIQTDIIEYDGNFYSTFCWIEDESFQVADLSGLPYECAYFFDGNLRFFRANDGYYDVDLTTMKEVKLCDAQLENSGVRFLQANCVLESNLIKQNSDTPDGQGFSLPRVGEGTLRLFNGQEWKDVELPEELKNLPDDTYLYVSTLTGEYIICVAAIDDTSRYYRIDLAAENLKLEYWFDRN